MMLAQNIVLAAVTGDLITEGLVTLVVGMSVVFLALIALVILLEISGKFFSNLKKKDNTKEVVTPLTQGDLIAPESATEAIDDAELVAVITAAIAASLGTTSDNLQVRSLRKTGSTWNKMGRIEQLYN